MVVYGIKNCSTVKKAVDWLNENKIDFEFHDYKKVGISEKKIEEWQNSVSWEMLINKRGTTWRKLDPELQASIINAPAAKALMIAHTSLIKRPIIEGDHVFLLGFDAQEYQQKLLP